MKIQEHTELGVYKKGYVERDRGASLNKTYDEIRGDSWP